MTSTSAASSAPRPSARVRVQRIGTFLSNMVMPNLAAFIAWGLITALFIATGWLPNGVLGGFGDASVIGWQGAATALAEAEDGTTFTQYVGLVGPMLTYLLPLLIANTGGRMVYGERGGVVATIATMGVIVGSTIPMFIGAMIVGPLAAWLMKRLDALWEGKIKAGFEMLVNNFSAGILGMLLALAAFFGIAPVITWLTDVLESAVDWLVASHLLPLSSVLIEPAKVLFLNNAINHGVMTPIGAAQAKETGQSILFLLEANPGPGLGILLAFSFFGIGAAKASAPGAALIQFIGGIHEIYFPYVLMKPLIILSAIAGGATGVAINVLFDSGLRAPAAPGSIIAVLAQTPGSSMVGVIASVIGATLVSFLVSAVILRASRKRDLELGEDAGNLGAAVAQTEANKGKSSSVLGNLAATASASTSSVRPIRTIVFACDAGMGSSAMGASVLRNRFTKAGVEGVTITNQAISNLDDTADLVITQRELTDRARGMSPSSDHVSVDNFMNSPRYDEVISLVSEQQSNEGVS